MERTDTLIATLTKLTLSQSKQIHFLTTETHANKSKGLFIPTMIVQELPILKFYSTPTKLIIEAQKAWK